MAFDELREDQQWFVNVLKSMKKKFDEQSKIIKQNPKHENPIFMSHVIMKKEFLLSFIQPYQNHQGEINIEELQHFVNPTKFKNGIVIISKHSTLTNGHSHLNGSDSFSNDEVFNDVEIPLKTREYIRCGNAFSASEVFALGKKDFHGSLGPIKKSTMPLSGLDTLSFSESRYVSALITQVSRAHFNLVENRPFLIHCEPAKPLHVRTLILFPETLCDKRSLRIIQVRDDDGNASKTYRAGFEEGSYSAGYDILKGLISDNTNSTSNDVTSLKAVFCWPTSRNQMDSLPPHSSKSVLEVQVALGEQQSPLNEIFLELTKLDSIANTTLNDLSNNEESVSFNMDQLYESLASFKETVSNFSFYGPGDEKNEENDEDLEKPMAQLIRQRFQRHDHDFTDKLWLFLRNAEGGFQEMKFYLDEIINDIVYGSLQPAVSPMNSTKLAKLVRKMYVEELEEAKIPIKEKILEFLSSDTSLVNLIVEIGFEKMRKDYYHYLVNNELTVIPSLDKMRGKQPIGLGSHSNDIGFLWKLHCCLEIVITPTVYLRLDHDSQRSLLNSALEYYTKNSVKSTSPTFCLSLLPVHDTLSNVLNSCTSRLPDIWKEGIFRRNKGGVREVCITCQENENSIVDDEMNSPTDGSDRRLVNTKLGLVLCENVIELPN